MFVCLLDLFFFFMGAVLQLPFLNSRAARTGMVRVFRKQLRIILETHEEGSIALAWWNEKGQHRTLGKWSRSELGSKN